MPARLAAGRERQIVGWCRSTAASASGASRRARSQQVSAQHLLREAEHRPIGGAAPQGDRGRCAGGFRKSDVGRKAHPKRRKSARRAFLRRCLRPSHHEVADERHAAMWEAGLVAERIVTRGNSRGDGQLRLRGLGRRRHLCRGRPCQKSKQERAEKCAHQPIPPCPGHPSQ